VYALKEFDLFSSLFVAAASLAFVASVTYTYTSYNKYDEILQKYNNIKTSLLQQMKQADTYPLDELEKSFQHLQVAEKFLRYHPSDTLIQLKPLISLLTPKEYTFHALNETTPTYSIVFEKKFYSLTEFYNFKQKFQHTFQTINKENKLTYNERTNYTSLNFFVTLSSGESVKTSHTTKRRRRR
jgi:hypothetical protein